MQRVNEVFGDYNTESSITLATVKKVVLKKKNKILEICLDSDNYIEIDEIEKFKNFLNERFKLNDAILNIEYSEKAEKKPIDEEFHNIIEFLSNKHPYLKSVLKNSVYEIENDVINFDFKIPVSGMLKKMQYDRKIQETVKNIYKKTYRVNFVDKVDIEEVEKFKQDENKKRMLTYQKEIKANLSNETLNTPSVTGEDIKCDKKKSNPFLIVGRSTKIKDSIVKIIDITPDEGKVAVEGELSNMESRELRSGKVLVSFDLYDGSSSMTCKSFLKPEDSQEALIKLKKAKAVKIVGNAGYSKFSGEVEIIANVIIEIGRAKKIIRQDNAEVKRVELHMHTKMSQMDAMTSAGDLIKRAMDWGMKSIAITDHGVVQAFPEAHKLLGRDNKEMKVIYGVEAYLAPDKKSCVTNEKGQDIDTIYCVLDLETTGFSPKLEKITEIGIMKIQKDRKSVV